jgi:hypothetical protein
MKRLAKWIVLVIAGAVTMPIVLNNGVPRLSTII